MTGNSGSPLSIAMIGLRGIPATYGGVETAVEELSASLVDRGHKVTVFARDAYSDGLVTEHRGVNVVHMGQINTKHLEAISHTSLAISSALIRHRFDVIHLHATGPGLLSFVPRVCGVPVVATVQGLDWRREKWGLVASSVLKVAARASVAFPTRTIVVSRELQRHFRESLGAETVYIPNGVHVEDPGGTRIEELEADRFILFLGRLVPEKHVHTLIDAYNRIDTDIPLVIAGPGSHSPQYVTQLEQMAAQDSRVRLLGPRYGEEKTWLMSNALAFVQPSSIEGLPIALLEALAAGRYPIVSDIPENLEPVTVDGQRLGLQVRVNDPDDLARALQEAITAQNRPEVGDRLKRHVLDEYDWSHIAARTEAVYEEAVRSRPRRRARAA